MPFNFAALPALLPYWILSAILSAIYMHACNSEQRHTHILLSELPYADMQ